MKKADVKIGGVFYANVSGKKAKVRIDAEASGGGWTATNLETNKSVRIKTAQRLLGAARGGKGQSQTTTEGNLKVVEVEPVAVITTNMPAAEDKPRKKSKAIADAPKKLSALSAAHKVLAESHEPMNVQQMVEAMSTKGYWTSPGGKTPHATLYSAILRELTKGDASRFVKTERGKFAAAE